MSQKLTERVAWALETIKADRDLDKGITDVALAKILGTNKDTLAAYRQEKGLLKGEVIDGLVRHYHFSPQWLFTGEGEPFPGARAKYPEVCGPEDLYSVPAQRRGLWSGDPLPPDFPADDFVFIRQINGRISAGHGLHPDNTADVQCAFRKDYIRRKGGKPDNMSLIKVSGDSMEPTLLDGDLALVNHARTTVAPQGGIYAIAIGNEIMIKRVEVLFPQGKLRILSDNSRYAPMEVDADQIKINGKVIWFGRDMER